MIAGLYIFVYTRDLFTFQANETIPVKEKIVRVVSGAETMNILRTPAHCIWSEQMSFCATLKQADVPLDDKWPLMILFLRSIKDNVVYSERQKTELQELLLFLLGKKDFSEAVYRDTEQKIHAITSSIWKEKIQEIARETSELAKDVYTIFGRRCEDMAAIANKMDSDLADGIDPKRMLTDLRNSLRGVMLKMAEDAESLMTLSLQDSLTGLANRRRLDDFLGKAVSSWLENKTPTSMIMLDIDHFKKVNDTFGHPVGDQVLQALASQINKILSPLATGGGDILAARYGGEEFSIVICGEAESKVLTVAEEIRKSAGKIAIVLPEKAENSRKKLSVTISLGVASLWDGWLGAHQTNLIDFADKALYRAKTRGRNCIVQHLPESKEGYAVVFSG